MQLLWKSLVCRSMREFWGPIFGRFARQTSYPSSTFSSEPIAHIATCLKCGPCEKDPAYNLVRWLTRNEDDAQDVVQEAYLRAFRFFDGFKGGHGKAWLLAVVRNTCLTWRRRERGNVTAIPFDETAHGSDRAANAEAGLVEEARLGTLLNCIEWL